MCAIAGILHFDRFSDRVEREELLRMRDTMAKRGPDGAGEWYSADGKVGLAHRRLSIIDLSEAGAQPMVVSGSRDPTPNSRLGGPGSNQARSSGGYTQGSKGYAPGSLVITFNGEIYNYRELRAQLESCGYIFRSKTDTEVLLHLYAEHGEAMVDHLRGMYAFAIWDESARSLFLARDPFGIKPLYYYQDETQFCFASQAKALLTLDKIDRASDPAGQVGFFLWGHVPEPYSLHRRIRALPAGAVVTVAPGGDVSPKQRSTISDLLAVPNDHLSAPRNGDIAPFFRRELLDAITHHLIADVPTGVFLSAGLDSTIIAALAAQTDPELRTVTLGFEEYRGTDQDETVVAEATARRIKARHSTIWISRGDFNRHYDDLLHAMDLPSTDGVNSFFISQAAVESGLKVALSGLGGDELFGSYPSFREIPRAVRNFKSASRVPGLGKSFRRVAAPVCKHFTSPKYAGLLEYGGTYGGAYLLRRGMFMPWELPALLGPDVARAGWSELQPIVALNDQADRFSSPHLKVAAMELQNYMRNQLLRDTDWASMAHSLEIRTPLLDLPLTRALAPRFARDSALKKSDIARFALPGFPEELFHRPKTGFTVPVREWLISSDQKTNRSNRSRGLRGWARQIYRAFSSDDALPSSKIH